MSEYDEGSHSRQKICARFHMRFLEWKFEHCLAVSQIPSLTRILEGDSSLPHQRERKSVSFRFPLQRQVFPAALSEARRMAVPRGAFGRSPLWRTCRSPIRNNLFSSLSPFVSDFSVTRYSLAFLKAWRMSSSISGDNFPLFVVYTASMSPL